MTYNKPEVAVLGDAARVIEQTGQKLIVNKVDPLTSRPPFNPAYDLDE
jgi:hypothetical protein